MSSYTELLRQFNLSDKPIKEVVPNLPMVADATFTDEQDFLDYCDLAINYSQEEMFAKQYESATMRLYDLLGGLQRPPFVALAGCNAVYAYKTQCYLRLANIFAQTKNRRARLSVLHDWAMVSGLKDPNIVPVYTLETLRPYLRWKFCWITLIVLLAVTMTGLTKDGCIILMLVYLVVYWIAFATAWNRKKKKVLAEIQA